MHWRRKWQPPPVFLPGESQGRGSLLGCRLWGRTESDTTEAAAAAAVFKKTTTLFKNYFYLLITAWPQFLEFLTFNDIFSVCSATQLP